MDEKRVRIIILLDVQYLRYAYFVEHDRQSSIIIFIKHMKIFRFPITIIIMINVKRHKSREM